MMNRLMLMLATLGLGTTAASATVLHFDVSYATGTSESFDVDTAIAGTYSPGSIKYFGEPHDVDFAITNDSLGHAVLVAGDARDGYYFATGTSDATAFFGDVKTYTNTPTAPFYDGSSLILRATPGTIATRDGSTIRIAGAVPEPATWAMLAGGFGLVGASLRGRRRRGLA